MSIEFILLQLAGYVALLLWGTHMVSSGIVRAYGSQLRGLLRNGLANRWRAFAAGLGITAILQSSTATAFMSASFLATGLIALEPALAVTLGANVGTTLIVQILAFDVSMVAPVIVLAGFACFKLAHRTRLRDLGRAGMGIGLILLALHLIVTTLEPVEQARTLRDLLAAAADAPMLSVTAAALLTWAAYSSVATVLLTMALAAQNVVPPACAMALVLGANLGNVIPQYLAAGTNDDARRLALGNLVMRGTVCLAALPFLPVLSAQFTSFEPDPARLVADFHTVFNAAVAAVFIGVLNPLAALCARAIASKPAAVEPGTPVYLDRNAIGVPNVALADATRETLRLVDLIDSMLADFLTALRDNDRKVLTRISRFDDTVDTLYRSIKLYLAEMARVDRLDAREAERCAEILAFATNLEHSGDILEKSLREIAAKKIRRGLSFSAEGFGEITDMHERLVAALRLSAAVFVSSDLNAARQLVKEKERMRHLERAATENHFRRLRDGRQDSVETSALHCDIARDLKRIAAHVAAIALVPLERNGKLLQSRLVG